MGIFGKKDSAEDQEAAKATKVAEKEQRKAAAQQEKADREEQQVAKLEANAREKAVKKGLDVDGALVVAHDLSKDSAWETLIVWPDRVEKHNHGKVGSLTRSGKGVESMPIGKRCERRGEE